VKKFVRSETYARARLVTGTMYVLLGGVIIGRIAMAASGRDWRSIAAYVLGVALILLGLNRWREWNMVRRRPPS
jgi:sulfite exporter TauE/SafE